MLYCKRIMRYANEGMKGSRIDMELYREIKHMITPDEADFIGKWRPGDVFRAMQRAAEIHANELGWGYSVLKEKNIAWVLTRTQVQIEAYPNVWDEITIATWTGRIKHSVFPRYFEFRSADGTVLGKAVTLWVLLDLEERCMVSADKAQIQVPEDEGHEPALPFPAAPRELKGIEPIRIEKHPVYTDFDINGHVNNTRYIDWLCDLFTTERYREYSINELTVNYAGEILPGTELSLLLAEDGDVFSLRDCPEGKAHFTIQGSWARQK